MDLKRCMTCVIFICDIWYAFGDNKRQEEDEAFDYRMGSIQAVPRVERSDESTDARFSALQNIPRLERNVELQEVHKRSKRAFYISGSLWRIRRTCRTRCRSWWWWRRCSTSCSWYTYRIPAPSISSTSGLINCRESPSESSQFSLSVYAYTSGGSSISSRIRVHRHSCNSVSGSRSSWTVTSNKPWCYVTFRVNDGRYQRRSTSYVYLKVPTCSYPPRVPNGYRSIHSRRVGGTVNYTCAEGYNLIGPSTATCLRHWWSSCGATWSERAKTSCQLIKCDERPQPPAYGTIKCASLNVPRATCQRRCDKGFKSKGKDVVTCVTSANMTGHWNQTEFECQDIQSPTLKCSDDIEVVVDRVEKGTPPSSVVYWDDPVGDDNVNVSYIEQTEGPSNGSLMLLGLHTIVYEVKDTSGNMANCSFDINVRAQRCQPINLTEGLLVKECTSENVYGSECELGCGEGTDITGNPLTVCEMSEDEKLYWTHTVYNIRCTKCGSIRAPINGAMSCFHLSQVRICTALCYDGYDFSAASGSVVYTFTCQEDVGVWSPKNTADNCIKTVNGIGVSTKPKWRYVSSKDCTDSAVLEQVKQKTDLAVQDVGICSGTCNITHIDVLCSKLKQSRRKRSTSTHEIIVELTMEIASTPGSDYHSLANVLYEECTNLDTAVRAGQLELEAPELGLEIDQDSVSYGLAEIACPKGTYARGISNNCVGCPYGSYYDETNNTCVLCPVGRFQDEESQTSCKQCPEPLTTHTTGAFNVSDCRSICPPGTSSTTGLSPCTLCPRSTYNPLEGQTQCILCPDGKTTKDDGTIFLRHCRAADLIFGAPGRPSKPLKVLRGLNPPDTIIYDDNLTVVFGIRLENASTSCDVLTIKDFDSNEHILSLRVHDYNITAVTLLDSTVTTNIYKDSLQQGMAHIAFASGSNSEDGNQIEIVEFHNNDKRNNSTHTARIPHSERLVYINGKLDITIGNNCKNAMITQLSVLHGYKTSLLTQPYICNSVVSGKFLDFTDLMRAEAATPYIRVPSLCSQADFCLEKPCENNGTCLRKFRGFMCECLQGFTGITCGTNINDCDAAACENEADCVDGIDSYTCTCKDGYTGTLCENQIVHGGWSEWSEWDECSTTCDEGQRSRRKLCNSPLPQHGGDFCSGTGIHAQDDDDADENTGINVETEECNNGDCPNCTKVLAPVNGTVDNCERYEDGAMSCNITCDDNYVLDTDSDIECNDNSSYLWPDQDPASTFYRPPACKAIDLPTSVDVEIAIPYNGVKCKGERTNTTKALQQTADMNAEKTNCNGNCTQEVNVRCDDLGRSKRDAESPNAFITYKIKADIYSPVLQGGDDDTRTQQEIDEEIDKYLVSYEAAFDSIAFAGETLANETMQGGFDFEVDGVAYASNVDMVDTSGQISCPQGSVLTDGVCSVCGVGTFYGDLYGCIPCPVGEYQDQERQTACKLCPEDFTTENTGSIDMAECNVMLTTPEPPTTAAIPVSTAGTEHVTSDVMSSAEARQDTNDKAAVSPSTDLIIGLTIGCSVFAVCIVIAIIAVLVIKNGKRSQQYVLKQEDYK